MSRVVYRNLQNILNKDGTLPDRVRDIDCCYHDRPFDGKPVPVVEEYDQHRDVFYVRRVACRPECAKSFLAQSSGDWYRTLIMLQRRLTAQLGIIDPFRPVPYARSKDALDYKGGHMTLEEWLQPLHVDDATGNLLPVVTEPPKMIPHRVMLRMSDKDFPLDTVDNDDTTTTVEDKAEEEDNGIPLAASNLKDLSTHNIRRPPEDQCIKTVEQLTKAYPDMDLCDPDPGPFHDWVERARAAGSLPNDEQCKNHLAKRASEKRTRRANKKKAGMAQQQGSKTNT